MSGLSGGLSAAGLFLLAMPVVGSGCTFYTACPDNRPPPPNTGGTGNVDGNNPDIIGGEPATGEWVNRTYNLASLPSECGNLAHISAKPGTDQVLAGVALNGLWVIGPEDEQWSQLGQGDGSATIVNRPSSVVYDPENPGVFWESGLYNGAGVFRTDDDGDTFLALGTVPHSDAVSVDLSDPDRQTLLASGHEQGHVLRLSTDGGTTWEDIGDNVPGEANNCPYPLVLDASTFLLGCDTYGGGQAGLFRSVDSGETWARVSPNGGGAAPLVASDGTIYWMGEQGGGLVSSTDDGKTWSSPVGRAELGRASPIELPDGRLAALGNGRMVVSVDQGEHWRIVSAATPFPAKGAIYSARAKRFYIFYPTCAADVPEDAVMSYDFDYETE